jgi:hypothetical protein
MHARIFVEKIECALRRCVPIAVERTDIAPKRAKLGLLMIERLLDHQFVKAP